MNLRLRALEHAATRRPAPVNVPVERPATYFGKYVFGFDKMPQYLPPETCNSLRRTIKLGEPLSRDVADSVAQGMKRWAAELGATHCTHWFQPLTEGTAEKHDAFIERDAEGCIVEQLTGRMLVQQEPDASSFPSGGIRSTFEARGYSAWDPASPVFIVGDTLMIPTVFIAYTGQALDYKAPLKKSLAALDRAATNVARLFDPAARHVTCYLGWEQEYFLVDEALYNARPDLVQTGRTLLGHSAAKNQQMDDHYFGAIPERTLAFMQDLEIQALQLGIPLKTRHNEVAPNQFEFAPIFEECNLAVDHNMLLMSLMRRVARRHGLRCLLHEKPFAGVNGSGKHANWSLQTDTGTHLHAPGRTPQDNLRFAVFLTETLMGVWRYNGLLKASVVSAGNEHRLGTHEAPPAIISAFIGQQLEELLDHIASQPAERLFSLKGKQGMRLDIPQVPEILIDNTDRNRTSPFAFTGNRFEFRAVGSSANCASALIVLNTAVADAMADFHHRVEERGGGMEAIVRTLREDIATCRPILFSGNGYSLEWQQEARRRGLDCESSAPIVIGRYTEEESVKLFERTGVFSRTELEARNEIKWETYHKKLQIEARVLGDLCQNHVIPVAMRYQTALCENVRALTDALPREYAAKLSEGNIDLIGRIAEHLAAIAAHVAEMNALRKETEQMPAGRDKAVAYHDRILPFFNRIRSHADQIELIVDDEAWPLPKYRELLLV